MVPARRRCRHSDGMSMIGLAASPGTDVDPMCSTATVASPPEFRASCRRYSAGQLSSGATKEQVALLDPPTSSTSVTSPW